MDDQPTPAVADSNDDLPVLELRPADSPPNPDVARALVKAANDLLESAGINHCLQTLLNGNGWVEGISACQQCVPKGNAATLGGAAMVTSAAAAVNEAIDKADGPVPANVMYVRFSKSFLDKHLSKQYERTAPVNDVILGADVSGTSHTVARTELELLPSTGTAQVRLVFRGETTYETTSVSGPIQIYSRGVTRFASEKRLSFDGVDVHQTEPVTEAETNTTTLGITTNLPPIADRIARRIAAGEEAASHSQAEAITNERTKQKVERAFDRVVREHTAAFTKELKAQYAKLPIDGRFAIHEIHCSTAPEMLQIVVLGRGDQRPTFAAVPDLCAAGPDIEVHIHTALVSKAIVNAEMRDAVVSTVEAVISGPLATRQTHVTNFRGPLNSATDQQFAVRWPEAEGDRWLSIAWHANPHADARQARQPDPGPR